MAVCDASVFCLQDTMASRDGPAPTCVNKNTSATMLTLNASNACRVLASTVLSPESIVDNRAKVRGLLLARFPDLALVAARSSDRLTGAYLGADVERGLQDAAQLDGAARAASLAQEAPELTLDAVVALVKVYDAVVFGGSLSAAFAQKGWALEVAVSNKPRDVIRIVTTPSGRQVAKRVPAKVHGVEIDVSLRVPDTYCFKHADSPPHIFGVPCKDALDCVMVQVEHQLVHAALLMGGCADADTSVAAALDTAAAAPDLASVAVALDSLPHSELMTVAVANVFGHATPLHGAHVWSVPLGSNSPLGTPPCCMRKIPTESRPVFRPAHTIPSLWRARRAVRQALKQGPVAAIAFDPEVGAWTSGWRVTRVSRWYVELVGDIGCGRPSNRVLEVPIPFARPYINLTAEPRLPDARVPGGYWNMLAFGTLALLLPTAEDDLAATAIADETAEYESLSKAAQTKYADTAIKGLQIVTFLGPVDDMGRTVQVQSGTAATIVPALRILPLSVVVDDMYA